MEEEIDTNNELFVLFNEADEMEERIEIEEGKYRAPSPVSSSFVSY